MAQKPVHGAAAGVSHIADNWAATKLLVWCATALGAIALGLATWVVVTVKDLDKGSAVEAATLVQLAKDQDATTLNVDKLADKIDHLTDTVTSVQVADGANGTKLSQISDQVGHVNLKATGIWRDIASMRGALIKRGIPMPDLPYQPDE